MTLYSGDFSESDGDEQAIPTENTEAILAQLTETQHARDHLIAMCESQSSQIAELRQRLDDSLSLQAESLVAEAIPAEHALDISGVALVTEPAATSLSELISMALQWCALDLFKGNVLGVAPPDESSTTALLMACTNLSAYLTSAGDRATKKEAIR